MSSQQKPNTVQDPPFKVPTESPSKWTPDTVIPYVKTGMMIELSTIPIYLYAKFSIKPDNGNMGTQARASIKGIVEQEMLHLSLTGNLLSALNGSLDLYDYSVIPRFPAEILIQKIAMNLDQAIKSNLECFLEIESPDTPRPQPDNSEPGLLPEPSLKQRQKRDVESFAPQYKSIGDFYEDLEKGIKKLPDSAFSNNPDKQFSGQDFFGDQMIVITDQSSALQALTTIIEQGEGNIVVPDSHYSVFVKLYLNREAWECYNVRKNPQTKDYAGNSKKIDAGTSDSKKDRVYKISLAFDAGYCYLLQSIQRVWQTGKDSIVLRVLLLRNTHAIMTNVLTPLANMLVQLQLDDNTAAAPCFNYYPMRNDGQPNPPLGPTDLWKALRDRLSDAISATPPRTADSDILLNIFNYIDKVPPFP